MSGIRDREYPLAENAIFWTVQGEGSLLGTPMRFVRMAGCSVNCNGCDTNYRLARKATATRIGEELDALPRTDWIWVTGGEPADHDLWPLFEVCRLRGKVAIATSGTKGLGGLPWDFLSVSPHHTPKELVLTRGGQINLVPGLNGLRLGDWNGYFPAGYRDWFVTPMGGADHGIAECLGFIRENRGWRLGVQAHKVWGLP